VKLGRISYVNMAPVFYRVDADVEEVQGVPTELNRLLIEGELDTAPISSIEYARNADKLRLLPRLCVASEGAVDSIQLVSRRPLEQVRVVAVTSESATSVALTKVLLPEADQVPLEAYESGDSDATHSRGSRRSLSALRAYSIDEIGAVSSAPSISSRFSSVGTPCTSSTSASTR
jgi:predicted solute-binding protein